MTDPVSVPPSRPAFSRRTVQLIEALRLMLRDYPELNRLIDGYESSPRFLAWALVDALDDINNTPPSLGQFTLDTFPYASLLIRGAAANVIESVGLLQLRNHLPFSDGGIQVGISSKSPMLQSWAGMFRAQYERKLQQYKVSQNIERAWGGGVHSDYWFIGGYYWG